MEAVVSIDGGVGDRLGNLEPANDLPAGWKFGKRNPGLFELLTTQLVCGVSGGCRTAGGRGVDVLPQPAHNDLVPWSISFELRPQASRLGTGAPQGSLSRSRALCWLCTGFRIGGHHDSIQ